MTYYYVEWNNKNANLSIAFFRCLDTVYTLTVYSFFDANNDQKVYIDWLTTQQNWVVNFCDLLYVCVLYIRFLHITVSQSNKHEWDFWRFWDINRPALQKSSQTSQLQTWLSSFAGFKRASVAGCSPHSQQISGYKL